MLLVSDNRDNANWGSRSTTMALLELLELGGFVPTDRMMDSEVRSSAPLSGNPLMERLLRRPAASRLAGAALTRGGRTRLVVTRGFGLADAASDDPAETVRRWRRTKRGPFRRWIERVERATALIINGEGSMIFTTPSRLEQRFHLAVMQIAHEAHVPFAYVNALVADPSAGIRNPETLAATRALLPHASLVTTRDPWSQAFLCEVAPEVTSQYVPDAVFAWHERHRFDKGLLSRPEYLVPFHELPEQLGVWDFQQPYICVGGSSEAAKDPGRALEAYRNLLEALPRLGLPLVVTVSSTGDTFLEELAHDLGLPLVPVSTNLMVAAQILANAEIVVTGRYHPTILAGLAGVPCVLLGADSHKTASVQEMLGYPDVHVFSEFPTDADVEAIIERARGILQTRQQWSTAITKAVSARAVEARRLSDHLATLRESAPEVR